MGTEESPPLDLNIVIIYGVCDINLLVDNERESYDTRPPINICAFFMLSVFSFFCLVFIHPFFFFIIVLQERKQQCLVIPALVGVYSSTYAICDHGISHLRIE